MIDIQITTTEGGEWFQADDVIDFLKSRYGDHAPEGAKLYCQHISEYTDVTPTSLESEQAIKDMEGPFYFVAMPHGPETWTAIAISVALSAASMLIQAIFTPSAPNASQRNVQQESPNNSLSRRTNQARINGRLADIYGTVRSTFDLLASPYKVYEDHVEKEICYMAIGRGAYQIGDIRDDTTHINQIPGSSVEVYAPFTSPNSGSMPQLRIGNAINLPVVMAKRSNSVNGQILNAPDAGGVNNSPIRFVSPNFIRTEDPEVDFTEHFLPGDVVNVSNAIKREGRLSYSVPFETPAFAGEIDDDEYGIYFQNDITATFQVGDSVTLSSARFNWEIENPEGQNSYAAVELSGNYIIASINYNGTFTRMNLGDAAQVNNDWTKLPGLSSIPAVPYSPNGSPTLSKQSGDILYDLSGTYNISTVTGNQITLNDPALVNSGWNTLASLGGNSGILNGINLFTSAERWVGWFIVESTIPINRFIANIVAQSGLYAENASAQYKRNVSFRLEAQRVDSVGVPYGVVQAYEHTVIGSSTSKRRRAYTLNADLPGDISNRWRFRVRRITPSDLDFEGSMVEEIQWQDLYAVSNIAQPHFGNVTTVQSVTLATEGATAIKERKLNGLVTRMIPILDGDVFTTELYPSQYAADIFCSVALDPYIGNRSVNELDIPNIYNNALDVREYFGFEEVSHFNYTFDKEGLSFEETASSIAKAIFCQAYRRGEKLRLFFEKQTDESSLLFNHRNTIPGSESRKISFSTIEQYDGVKYSYVSPVDDAVITLYVPNDGVINPKPVESIGIRRADQAHLHAWREWNRLQYQHTTMERTTLQQADLLVVGERALMSDTTRSEEMGGYVKFVSGLLIGLSQPIDWQPGSTYNIFIQNSDGVTESIAITPGDNQLSAVLSRAPRVPIVLNTAQPTSYILSSSTGTQKAMPFILTEKSPSDGFTIDSTWINSDDRYYQNDGDFRP